MKATGITRKIDELGRIVLPIELRRTMDLGERDTIEIFTEADAIILKKHQESCVFCGGTKGIVTYKGKNLCPQCLRDLKSL